MSDSGTRRRERGATRTSEAATESDKKRLHERLKSAVSPEETELEAHRKRSVLHLYFERLGGGEGEAKDNKSTQLKSMCSFTFLPI